MPSIDLEKIIKKHLQDTSSEIFRENMRVKEYENHLSPRKGERIAVIPWSGGLDSTACVIQAIESNLSFITAYVNYGQSYSEPETQATSDISKRLRQDYTRIDKIWRQHLALNIQEEYQKLASSFSGEWEHIFPFRNFIIILKVLEASVEITQMYSDYPELWFPSVQGEMPYSGGDKSRIFLTELQRVLLETNSNPTLVTPLIGLAKPDIVAWSLNKPRRYRSILLTYSCFKGTTPPCGKCIACFRKASAFYANDVIGDLGFKLDTKQMLTIAHDYHGKFKQHLYYSTTRRETVDKFLKHLENHD